jgi:hypothetical protein
MNLHAVLTDAILIHWVPRWNTSESILQIPLGGFLRSPEGIFISVLLQTGVFLFALWSLRSDSTEADAIDSVTLKIPDRVRNLQ